MVKKFKVLYGGECYHPEKTVNIKGSFKMMKFPAIFFFMELEDGKKMLFDTGYSEIFFEATKKMPFWFYRKLTNVKLSAKNIHQTLLSVGVECKEIDYLFISHFHPDHIGNLKSFPNAKFITHSKAYHSVKNLKGIKALKKGFLREHLPEDFENRVIFYDKTFEKLSSPKHNVPALLFDLFENVYTLFNGAIFAVEMEGHINGHSGVLFHIDDKIIFLIADSVWQQDEFINLKFLPAIARLVFNNFPKYKENVINLHKMKNDMKNIIIIPSHCEKAYNEVCKNEDFI